MLFNSAFADNTISSCSFFFFLNYWLIILTPAVIVQISNLVAELIISVGILTKEAKAEIETHLIAVKAKVKKRSM